MDIYNKIIQHINQFPKSEDNSIYTIMFFGDSTVSTEWIHPNWRDIVEYVVKDKLERDLEDWKSPHFNLRFVNSGIDGGDTRDFLKRINFELTQFNPNLVIFIGCDNDEPLDIAMEESIRNINEVRAILSENVDDFSYGIQIKSNYEYHNKWIEEFASKYLEDQEIYPNEINFNLYQEFGKLDPKDLFTFRLLEGEAETMGIKDLEIKFDPYHPNKKGQAEIARIILDKVFGIKFDPQKFLANLNDEIKCPEY